MISVKSFNQDRIDLWNSVNRQLDPRWQSALQYLRSRKGAIFYSHEPIFENHFHPHQNLPKLLAAHGIPTVWFDGVRSMKQEIVLPPDAKETLQVRKLPSLPGRRFSLINRTNCAYQSWYLQRLMISMGGNPLLWVHVGMDGELSKRLPYIDVYSHYDDVYRHPSEYGLVQKARCVTVQNDFALQLAKSEKKHSRILPPAAFEADEIDIDEPPASLPPGFPKRRMGYVGSLLGEYFDFESFEYLVRSLPDWGFILAGRTDKRATAHIDRLSTYPNVAVFPAIPRRKVGSYWKLIDVCLLLYRPQKTQHGAFAAKTLEALYFGCSISGLLAPKTIGMAKYFPIVKNDSELLQAAVAAYNVDVATREGALQELLMEMHPKFYFATVVEQLKTV